MSLLPILEYPDPRLKQKAAPVRVFDAALARLAADMAETMYAAPGVGLAATQVDAHLRLVVIDVSEDKSALHVFVNPRLVRAEGKADFEEGCLSVPGFYDTVTRPALITVEAEDVTGKTFRLDAEGLLAVCVQHEMDHLEGKVFVEYLSTLKQIRLKARIKKRGRVS